MPPWNSLKPSTGHFDGVAGVFTLPDGEHAPMDRANTPQWAVASVRSSRDPFTNPTFGEKVFFGFFLLLGLVAALFIVPLAALGVFGPTKKLFAQLFLWRLFWVAVIFVVVFLAKTFWNWLPWVMAIRSFDPDDYVKTYSKLECNVCNQSFYYQGKHDPWHYVNGSKKGFICHPCYISSTHFIVRFLDFARATFVQLSFSGLILFLFYLVIKWLHE